MAIVIWLLKIKLQGDRVMYEIDILNRLAFKSIQSD